MPKKNVHIKKFEAYIILTVHSPIIASVSILSVSASNDRFDPPWLLTVEGGLYLLWLLNAFKKQKTHFTNVG